MGGEMTQAAPVVVPDFTGTVMTPDDPAYDAARTVFNAMIDRRPAVIARCNTAADVAAAIRYARSQQLEISVYGGGHGVTGSAVVDGGLCIDLRGIKTLDVDRAAMTVRAGGGLTWGELDAATQQHGLALTGGRMSSTGVAGLALGSGSGWLERKFGFTCDSLLEAEVVTADGRVVVASEDENPDLFWGLRGGGGNFGVVVNFEYRLHEVPPLLLGGMLLWPFDRAGDVLRRYREFIEDAPDEVSGAAAILTAPPAPFVPAELQGQHVVGVVAIALAAPEHGEELFRPLREFGPPAVDIVGPMPYTAVQQLLDPGNPPGLYNYWKAELVPELGDELIDLSIEHAERMGRSHSIMLFQPLGGEIARIPDDSSAITARQAAWTAHCIGEWETPAETEVELAWVKAWGSLIAPFTIAGAPLTFRADTGEAHVRRAYGEEKYARLVALKDKYDPQNLFRLNQNIKPSATRA